jgi:hypothetical protein
MGMSSVWKPSRLIAILAVLVLHLAVIALLLMSARSPVGPVATNPPIEVVFLPPAKAPKMLADIAPPKHLLTDVGVSISPPALDGSSSPAPVAQAGGGGAGVNWAAEAHRAVKAFEIRRDQNVSHASLGLSPWDGWLPEGVNLAGDKFRTDSGDWIVWINGNCYQVASWQEDAPLLDETGPRTICSSAPHDAADSSVGRPPGALELPSQDTFPPEVAR